MAPKLDIRHLTEPDALHCQYQGEFEPQPAYIELGLGDGVFLADYNSNMGPGVPGSVYHGIDLRWSIPVLTADAANALLEELAPLAQRLLDGSDVEWDGSNNVGRILTDEAQAAFDEITERCEAIDTSDDADGVLPVWHITTLGDPWTADEAGITATTTDDELDQIEQRLLSQFRDDMGQEHAVIDGLDEYLRDLRDELAGQVED